MYSNRVLHLFKIDNADFVKLTAVGGAVPTALRIADFCAKKMLTDFNINLTIDSEYSKFTKSEPALAGDGFGAVPSPEGSRTLNAITITLTRIR